MYGLDTFQTFWEENDPMRDIISLDLFQLYPNLLLLTVDRGGHCGFMEGLRKTSWVDKIIVEYLEKVNHLLKF